MARKKKEPVMHQYAVPCRMTFKGMVIVDAIDADDAAAKVNAGACDCDYIKTAERVDWDVDGEAELID